MRLSLALCLPVMRLSSLLLLVLAAVVVAVPTHRSSLPRSVALRRLNRNVVRHASSSSLSPRSHVANRAVELNTRPESARTPLLRPRTPLTNVKPRLQSPPQKLRPPLSRKYSSAPAASKKKSKKSPTNSKSKPLTGGEIHRRRRGSPDQGVLVDKSSEAPWYSFSFHGPDGLHYNNGNGYLLGYNYRDGHRYRNRPRRGNSYENREDFHYKDGNYYAYF